MKLDWFLIMQRQNVLPTTVKLDWFLIMQWQKNSSHLLLFNCYYLPWDFCESNVEEMNFQRNAKYVDITYLLSVTKLIVKI